tara:strand:+ start:325 stop:480 length:156 start_codon:yes stop_codon:yes gene_type:complete
LHFLIGVIIGGIAAYTQLKISGINTIMLLVMLLLPYFIFIKKIGKNIKEVA